MEFDNLEEDKKEKKLAFIKRLFISFAIGLVIFFIVFFLLWYNGVKSWVHYFSNACFASGVLLAGMGSLSVVKKEGFFDVAQFGLKQFGQTIKYSMSMKKDVGVDTDILSFKEEKRKVRVANWEGVVVGFVFIIASVVSSFFV